MVGNGQASQPQPVGFQIYTNSARRDARWKGKLRSSWKFGTMKSGSQVVASQENGNGVSSVAATKSMIAVAPQSQPEHRVVESPRARFGP